MNKIKYSRKGKEPARMSWLFGVPSENRRYFIKAGNPDGMGSIGEVANEFAKNIQLYSSKKYNLGIYINSAIYRKGRF